MTTALLLILTASLTSLIDWPGLLTRHYRARRAAKKFVWPPREVLERTLDDSIPF